MNDNTSISLDDIKIRDVYNGLEKLLIILVNKNFISLREVEDVIDVVTHETRGIFQTSLSVHISE